MPKGLMVLEEKRLERLPPEELALHLMRMPAKKRLETVLSRVDAEAVVAALAPQDFYFSVKEIGADDALPLLALARVEQINHLFDLEWWQKDSVAPAKAVDWLERLALASREKLLAWLQDADFELLVILFKRWISVTTVPEDVDLLEARDKLPLNTLDDLYYWESRYPQYEGFIKDLLSLLFEVHQGFYKELMDHILWAADVEMEEDAYRFHKGRLEDLAIPDFYDALEIYRSLRPEEMALRKEPALLKPEGASIPCFALALIPQGDLLQLSLQGIGDPLLLDSLQVELANLANKVIVADQLQADDPEALRRAVDKTVACVNLGLDLKSAGDLKLSIEVLGSTFLEHLFRLGQEEVANLRNRMKNLQLQGWFSRWPGGLRCLEPYWLESAEALLRKTPRLMRAPSESHASRHEDFFRTRKDLFEGKRLIDLFTALGPLFDALQVEADPLMDGLWKGGLVRSVEDVTLGLMIYTAAARFRQDGEWVVKPLAITKWPAAFSMLLPDPLEKLIRSWIDRIVPDASQREMVSAYLDPLFREYAEEMRPFTGGTPPDPRLVKHFLFSAD
ncbi:DUF6178 family protein [Desulforhabdus amnigena]|uniref:Uncharacterized protein n=1 Tax=Desulforhabdus amnigena TaxID=40218 RepID=A0A9W6D5E2_9BACT|nr:DUF6178 family protein [Desulforhabdus amnigena]GLI34527.1 hypothetical protein DAMNIGENAA_19600 [Desulforhabdus amnigena]